MVSALLLHGLLYLFDSMLLLVDNIQIPGFTKIIVACNIQKVANAANLLGEVGSCPAL